MTTLKDFHAAFAARGILAPGERFMQVELDVTSKCNLRCVMCYHSFEHFARARPVTLSVEAFAALADAVLPCAHTLALSLGSEPLMAPHFESVLRIAARYRVPNLTFYTNGILFTAALVDAVIECGVTRICVSVDGAVASTYESIRRGASFDRLLSNVRLLIRTREIRRVRTPRIRFDVVMMRRNIAELEDLVVLAHRLGVEEVNFFHMVSYEGLGTESESLVHDKRASNYWLGRALNAADRLGVHVAAAPEPFTVDGASATRLPASAPPAPYCRYPFFHLSMNSGGHVLACPFAHGQAPYGTLGSGTPIEAIWLGSQFTTLRERILANDPPAMCRRCSFLASQCPDTGRLFATRRA